MDNEPIYNIFGDGVRIDPKHLESLRRIALAAFLRVMSIEETPAEDQESDVDSEGLAEHDSDVSMAPDDSARDERANADV